MGIYTQLLAPPKTCVNAKGTWVFIVHFPKCRIYNVFEHITKASCTLSNKCSSLILHSELYSITNKQQKTAKSCSAVQHKSRAPVTPPGVVNDPNTATYIG